MQDYKILQIRSAILDKTSKWKKQIVKIWQPEVDEEQQMHFILLFMLFSV